MMAKSEKYVALMEKAEATNREADKTSPMPRMPEFDRNSIQSMNIRTAQQAIAAGLEMGDMNCVAEGAAMLAQWTGFYPWRDPPWSPSQDRRH